MMSRGVDAAKARQMFVSGFLSKGLSGVGSDTVKEVAISMMLNKFGSGRQSGSPKISARDVWAAPAGWIAMKLEIRDLHVAVEGREVIKGVSLNIGRESSTC